MTYWLLDTNVLSELRRPKPETKVTAFIATQPLESLFVSWVTMAESRFGIELVGDVSKRDDLKNWLSLMVRPMFDQRILPVSEDGLQEWVLGLEGLHNHRY